MGGITQSLSSLGGVPKTRIISAGANMTGGGNLEADRSFAALGGGGGGAAIPERAIVKPLVTDFTLLNAGTATIANGTNGVILTNPSSVGPNIRFAHWTKTALPVAPYSVIMRSVPMSLSSIASKYSQSLILRNAAGTQIIISGTFEEKLLIQRWASFTGFAATIFTPEAILQCPIWQRVRVTATEMIFGLSPDGFDWFEYSTVNIAATIVDIAQVGFGCFNNATVTVDLCQSFEVII